jgi:multidrug transporter EmrE-like cation transporter
MKQWKRDLALSIGLIVFCLVNYIYAELMDGRGAMTYRLARADSYMQLWLIVLAALSVLLLIRTLKNKPADAAVPMWTKLGVFVLAAVAVYLLTMPYIGFFISTVIFLTALITVYSLSMQQKKKGGISFYLQFAIWFLVSLIGTMIIYYLFSNVLHVIFPKFSLF